MNLDTCTPAQCGDILALLAFSVIVIAGLPGTVVALVANWLEIGMRDIERADAAFWPEDTTR